MGGGGGLKPRSGLRQAAFMEITSQFFIRGEFENEGTFKKSSDSRVCVVKDAVTAAVLSAKEWFSGEVPPSGAPLTFRTTTVERYSKSGMSLVVSGVVTDANGPSTHTRALLCAGDRS